MVVLNSLVPESKPAELQPQPTYYNADNGGWDHKCHPLGESDSGIQPSLFKYSEMKSLQNVKGTRHIYLSFKIATTFTFNLSACDNSPLLYYSNHTNGMGEYMKF